MSWSSSKPELKTTTITAQTTPEVILKTSENPTGRITVNAVGTFDSGNLEVGYLDGTTFEVYDSAILTADGGFELACGANKDVYLQATGASPDIDVIVQAVS